MKVAAWLRAGFVAVALTGSPALADDPPSPRTIDLARQVIDRTGLVRQTMDQLVPPLSQQLSAQLAKQGKPSGKDVTAAFASEFAKAFDNRSNGLVNQIVPIMAKNFTEDELDALVAFYSSPLGASVMKKMPAYVVAANTETAGWMRAVLPAILADTKQAMQAQGIAMPE